jgi:hypothetical protein
MIRLNRPAALFAFAFTAQFPISLHAASNSDLIGLWHSSEFLAEKSARETAGWSLKFSAPNRYEELIDSGYGVVEAWSGTFDLQKKVLYLQRDGSPNKTPYRVSFKSGLQLATLERNPIYAYRVQFARGEGTHASLAKLPRWPSTIEQAARATRQLLDANQLTAFAQTPQAQLEQKYRYGLSLYLRNAFGVWRGNQALVGALQSSAQQPLTSDELPNALLVGVWQQLQANSQTLQAAQEEPDQELASEEQAKVQQEQAQQQTEQEARARAQAKAEAEKQQVREAQAAKEELAKAVQEEQAAAQSNAEQAQPTKQPVSPAPAGNPQQPTCIATKTAQPASAQGKPNPQTKPPQPVTGSDGKPLPPCPEPPQAQPPKNID